MGERIFAWLLRLYPRNFRDEYGRECLELFRDRVRDETGFRRSARLWLDLLFDFVASVPQTYLDRPPKRASELCCDSGPRFIVLADLQPPWRSVLLGSALSFITLASFPSWFPPSRISHTTDTSNVAAENQYASHERQLVPPQAQHGGTPGATLRPLFDSEARHRIIERALGDLDEYYVDRAVAHRTAAAVLAHEANGDDDRATGPADFARAVTAQMQAASCDHDLELVYSPEPLPNFSAPPSPSSQAVSAAYRTAMLRSNCGFARVELLPHHIGYIKLDSFPELSVCRATAVAAMSKINDANAVIFDLRENRGGMGDMTAFIASYLFDHPEYWYSPRNNTTRESWLRSPHAGSKLTATPAYILTSRQTISAAEQFTYDLKMLKRATIVGETTAGGAHAGVFHRIDDHFGIAITEVKSINPYSKYDWNGTGIEPDVKTPSGDALNAAVRLIEKNVRRSRTNDH